ncbi:hypothetical protein V1L52_00270 [Treponema sp. HNW]|uniref:hypothetical protein n=1 Tax=Treponema sp. HNW TaxID=3116654 RepID=UPI003D0C1BBC
MKKRGLSVFLISLVIPFIANCNEDSIIGYTYINESESFISKVRFNSDKSLDVFTDDEWKHISPVIPDKNNLNFIVHRSDNPEFFESLGIGGEGIILLGFLSKDAKTLYMGAGFIFSKEESEKNSHAVTGDIYYTYINGLDNEDLFKVRFNADKSFDIFMNYGEWKNDGIVLSEEGTQNFIICSSIENDFPYTFGFFSENDKTLYLAFGDRFTREDSVSTKPKAEETTEPEFSNPALTVDSIDVGGITFRSTPEDLLIQYPNARVIYEDNHTEFLVDGLGGFDYVNFAFKDDKLFHILKHKSDLEFDKEVSTLVQKSVQELTEKYGKPKVYQSSPSFHSSYHISSAEWSYTWDKVNENERIFTWCGDLIITLDYDWIDDKYGGYRYYGRCSIDYELLRP